MMGKSHCRHKRLSQGGLQTGHAAMEAESVNSAKWSFADLQAFSSALC
jgi:hypothetical protein